MLRGQLAGASAESTSIIEKYTLADQVYEKIRAAIFGGEFKPGMELNQVEVAKHFGVSRVPVREALRRLQAERLLSANPYQRYVVALLSLEQLLELHDIRAELEAFGIRRTLAAPLVCGAGALRTRRRCSVTCAAVCPRKSGWSWIANFMSR